MPTLTDRGRSFLVHLSAPELLAVVGRPHARAAAAGARRAELVRDSAQPYARAGARVRAASALPRTSPNG